MSGPDSIGLQAYHFNGSTFDTPAMSQSTINAASGNSGGVLTLSANGSTPGTGIVWSSMPLSDDADHGVHQGVLRAFDANNLTNELWDSTINSSHDNPGLWPKYSLPLVANGKVYLGSFSNVLNVYGLLSVTPDFTISASPPTGSVPPGGSTTYTVSVGALNGFNSSVNLSASGLPMGATASFSPASISPGTSSTLTVNTTSSTPVGSATLTITGISGSLTHTATVMFNVTGSPDFTLTAAPTSATVGVGSSTSVTISAGALNGFTGSVSLAASGMPSGVTASFSPSSTITPGTSATLTLTASSSAVAEGRRR